VTAPDSVPASLILRTLGDVRLEGGPAALASRRKELTLLAYLARRAPRSVIRAELASLLWEDRADTRARQSLRQALVDLKRLVGAGLVLDGDAVRLESGLRLDAREFEEELARGNLVAAVQWWRGDFLGQMDEVGGEAFRGWVEAERQGLRRQLAMAYEQLVQDSAARGDRAAQLAHAERWADLRPLDEVPQRYVIEALAAAGRSAEARARHAATMARLQAELEDGPTAAFVALGERLARPSSPSAEVWRIGSAAVFTPDFIGREDALGELRAAWREVLAGGRVIMLIEGDPGIGKTRLCEDFLLEPALAAEGAVVLRAQPRRPAAAGVADVLRQLLAPLASAPGVRGAGRQALAEVAAVAPEFSERFPDLPVARGGPAALGDGLSEVLSAVADERPVVLFLDDLGALDSTARRLMMEALARHGSRLLAIVAIRSEDVDGGPVRAEFRSLPRVRRLTLTALDQHQVEAMLGSMLALRPGDRHTLAARLHAEGGGNPSYTVEMVSALVDDGSLAVHPDGSWHLAAMDEHHLPLPRSLREAVERRLTVLDVGTQRVVDAAAVLGRAFRRDLLVPVAELDGSATEAALGELLTRRLIRRVAGAPDTYEFAHELVARVAYERVPPERRSELHRAAARAWKREPPRPEAVAAVADHLARARASGRSRRTSRWRTVGIAALVFLAAALVAGGWALGPERRATLTTLVTRPRATLVPNRIVVAPLENRTGDSTLTPMGDMAADWIARGLTQTGQFQVVDPRTAWLTAKVVTQIPRLLRPGEVAVGIAQETGSGVVVSGSYYREGDSLRFEVQVTDVASHKLTRSLDPVSASVADPGGVIPTLARRTVATVASAVDTTSIGLSAGLGQPPSFLAFDETSRAWESFWRGDTTDLFQRTAHAIALDSAYMAPRLMEAYVRSLDGEWPAVDSLVRGIEAQRGRLTPVETAIVAGLRANLRGDRPGRVRAARELARLTPGSVEGYTLWAEMTLNVDDPDDALRALSHVDPDRGFLLFSAVYWQTMARAQHERREYRAELETARRGVRRFPDDVGPEVALARALAALGRTDAVRQEVARYVAREPTGPTDANYLLLASAAELRTHGHSAEAEALLASRLPAGPPPPADTLSREAERIGADLLYEAGRWADAGRRYADLLARHPDDIESVTGIGLAAARLGDRREATRAEEQLAGWTLPFAMGHTSYGRARLSAVLGDSATTVALLKRSFREGYPVVSIWERHVHTDREFAGWEQYAPFRELMGVP
jgi:DNA-binding SARP family transcriptional activator/TolB-like protein